MKKPFSVRIDKHLHRDASVVSAITDRSLCELVEVGLRKVIDEIASQDPKIAAMLRELRSE